MKKSTLVKLGIAMFCLVVLLDSMGIILEEKLLRNIFKPFITITLILLYLISANKVNYWYLLALFFAFIADILLLNSSDLFFMLALVPFFLMHLIYVSIAGRAIETFRSKDLFTAPLPYVLVLVSVIFLLHKNLNEFFIPISIYGVAVITFGSLAFYNYLQKRSVTSMLLLFGSFFFLISNAMSAIEKFLLYNKDLSVAIMFTYASAQFLIYRYMVQRSQAT